jgi:uncharacterized membrane protein YfcA
VEFIAVLLLGLLAGTVGGVVGFGASIMLMPVLVLVFGPREAVPIMSVASILANGSRVAVWWRDIDWKVTAAYSLTAVPAAVMGARTMLTLPSGLMDTLLGLFFLAMIPWRRWMLRQDWRLHYGHMMLVGAGIGYITGIVVSTGPINAPFFLAYGLVKGAYLGTEAMGSLAIYLTKTATFRHFDALPWAIVAKGLIVGSSLVGGAFIARRIVQQMNTEQFRHLMDGVLLLAGLALLLTTFARA